MQEIDGGFGGEPVVIIKKKKVVDRRLRAHGAWKVAFADFVTAMMALFMVMWLMSAGDATRDAVAGYFDDPKGFKDKLGSGQGAAGGGSVLNRTELETLAQQIESAVSEIAGLDENLRDHVEVSVGEDGLRIQLLENEDGLFFQSGNAAPTAQGRSTIQQIARQFAGMPNPIVIEGHTDSRPYRGRDNYSNWELSTDRANSARRILLDSGFSPDRIAEVRGFADMQLRNPADPEAAANRRISMILKYNEAPTTSATATPERAKESPLR